MRRARLAVIWGSALAWVSAWISVPCAAQTSPAADTAETSSTVVDRCVADHERAASLRTGPHWFEGRAVMTACAAEACPLAVRSDCTAWLDDLAKLMPTVLVIVERDDSAGPPVQTEIDGKAVELSEPPAPIELLPGQHHLRFALDGRAPIERDIDLAPGDKNKVIRVQLRRPHEPARVPPAPPPREIRWGRPVPVTTYALSGGAIAAFAASGALLASALSARNTARADCKPFCSSDVVQSIRTRLVLSDVSAGAGIALGGLAVFTFVTRPTIEVQAVRIAPDIGFSPKATTLTLRGTF